MRRVDVISDLAVTMDKNEIIDMYVSGSSIRSIARKIGTSNHTIKRRLDSWGIDRSDIVVEWYRVCPVCGENTYYKNKHSWHNNKNSKSPCSSCSNSNKWLGRSHTKAYKQHMSDIQSECSLNGAPVPSTTVVCCQNPTCEVEFEKKETSGKKFCTIECYNRYALQYMKDKVTAPEVQFAELLDSLDIEYEWQWEIDYKFFDFYIPSKNLLVEIDGTYWHGRGISDENLTEIQRVVRNNDNRKNDIAEKHGYTLIRLWEDEIVPKYIL